MRSNHEVEIGSKIQVLYMRKWWAAEVNATGLFATALLVDSPDGEKVIVGLLDGRDNGNAYGLPWRWPEEGGEV